MEHPIESSPIMRYPTLTSFNQNQLSDSTLFALTEASHPTTPRQPTHPVPPNAPARVRSPPTPPPPLPPVLSRSVTRYVPVRFNFETQRLEFIIIGIPENDEFGNPRSRDNWISMLKMFTQERYQDIWMTLNLEKYVDDEGNFDESEFMKDIRQ